MTWWSTYGNLPSSLFKGEVKVRNTILSLGPGNGFQATKHNIFTAASRSWLFDSLEFRETPLTSEGAPLRGGLANNVLSALASSGGKILQGTELIYLRPTGRYWFPVMPIQPPLLDKSLEPTKPKDFGVTAIVLDAKENQQLAVAIRAGKIGFAWWGATGDDFHCLPSQSIAPRLFVSELWGNSTAQDLAKEVIDQGMKKYFARKNSGDCYVNIRWSSASLATDKFDMFVLQELGLASEWRNLNIWYRQTMRSSGDNASSVTLSKEQVASLGLDS
jgi:hypothetical protein